MTISNEHQEELSQEIEQDIKELEKKEIQGNDFISCEICSCKILKEDVYKLDSDIHVCEECYYND